MRPIMPPVPGPEPDPAPEPDPVSDPSKDPDPETDDDLPEVKITRSPRMGRLYLRRKRNHAAMLIRLINDCAT